MLHKRDKTKMLYIDDVTYMNYQKQENHERE